MLTPKVQALFERAHGDLAAVGAPIDREAFTRHVVQLPGGRWVDGPSLRRMADAYVDAVYTAAEPVALKAALTRTAGNVKIWRFLECGVWATVGMSAATSAALTWLAHACPPAFPGAMDATIMAYDIAVTMGFATALYAHCHYSATHAKLTDEVNRRLQLDGKAQHDFESAFSREAHGVLKDAAIVLASLSVSPLVLMSLVGAIVLGRDSSSYGKSPAVAEAVERAPRRWPLR